MIDEKKTFLQQGSLLYDEMINMTQSDTIKRYLAFRIVANAMSFEDLIGLRQFVRMREIRNVLLAHKQESDFFEGFRAADEITEQAISPLIAFMSGNTGAVEPSYAPPELSDSELSAKFAAVVPAILAQYEHDFLSGNRLINNFLCFTGSSVQEVSSGELPGVFYRYHSSMAQFQLGQYIHNSVFADQDLTWLCRHAKLDMILHAQNLADCTFKDNLNGHSIDGLFEVMTQLGIGDLSALDALRHDQNYQNMYKDIRYVRNKLIGHMDKSLPTADLISKLDALPVQTIFDVVNLIDKAVREAARSHMAIRTRYSTGNQVLPAAAIIAVNGIKARAYH